MTKNYVITVIFILYASLSISQNLFSNGDFENYYNCPTNFGQANQLIGCVYTQDTPDYYNCSMYPSQANTGTGCMYLGSVKYTNSVTHEGINLELDAPLEIGREYTIKLAVNYGAKYYGTGYVANQYLGCYTLRFDFSMNSSNNGVPTNYSYEIDTESVQTNENTTFHNYSFTFTPTQASRYLYIVTTPTTKTMNNDPECKGTVFYNLIDNLDITPTDLLSTETFDVENFKIYPNPVVNNLHINLKNYSIESLIIYDTLGKEVSIPTKGKLDKSSIVLNLAHLESGLYFIKINNSIKKFIKK
jgi:hypothetical protein